MNAQITSLLHELKTGLREFYGPRLVDTLVFGSHARGVATSKSDVDVLVVLEGDVDPGEEIERTGEIVSDLCLAHNELISCIFVSNEWYQRADGSFVRNARREGVSV